MQLTPTISTLFTHYGRHYVDIWDEGDCLTLEVYLPPEDSVQSRAELRVYLEPGEMLNTGEGRFIYEYTRKALVLQYLINRHSSDEAYGLVKKQLRSLGAHANLEPSHRHTMAQRVAEFASHTEALFSFIAHLASQKLRA